MSEEWVARNEHENEKVNENDKTCEQHEKPHPPSSISKKLHKHDL